MPKVLGTPTVRFNLHNKSDKETYLVMFFRYPYNRKTQRLKYNPGLKIKTKYWDNESQFPKYSPQTSDLIGNLTDLRRIVLETYERFNGQLSLKEFRAELQHRWEGKPRPQEVEEKLPSFGEFLKKFLKRKKATVSRGTWKVINTWKNHLESFETYQGKEISFDDITPEFREAFISWCYKEQKHSINTVAKGLNVIQQIMSAASEKGLHSNDYPQTKSFKLKKVPTPTIALSREELQAIYNLDLSTASEGYQKARDLFLIGAYTGLRVSDYKRISPGHIITENGKKLISIMAQKTKKPVRIPLHPNLEAILERQSYEAPKLSDPKLNEYIKEVAKLAGITEKRAVYPSVGGEVVEQFEPKYSLVSSHTARRTFATQARINDWPSPLIRAITGHATDRQLDNYIDYQMYLATTQITEFYKEESNNNKRLKAI